MYSGNELQHYQEYMKCHLTILTCALILTGNDLEVNQYKKHDDDAVQDDQGHDGVLGDVGAQNAMQPLADATTSQIHTIYIYCKQ